MSAEIPGESANYQSLLQEIKERIRQSRLQAAASVNRELISLYWSIGRDILNRQNQEGWGTKVVERLANDLRGAFPDMRGISARNLKYMRAFAEAWPDRQIVQQLVALLPWGHHVRLLDSVKEPTVREWYVRQAVEHGWSRNILQHQIASNLEERQGKALTNFSRTLPPIQSELAQQLLKDPYHFDFLMLEEGMLERDLERELISRLSALILELGKGFAFVGSQYHLEVGDQDYYLDLLFYHLGLRCFVVFELKVEDFKPEFAGKMNFYLSAVDDHLKKPSDQPSIGVILCPGRNHIIVEYALRDSTKPLGVAQYKLSKALPPTLAEALPTSEQFAREYPAFSLVKLRYDIERVLRAVALQFNLNIDSPMHIRSILDEMKGNKIAPSSTDALLGALKHMNQAAHGADLDASLVADAVKSGEHFLQEAKALLKS